MQWKSLIPGASEMVVYRTYIAVPRIDTDALAEKAKTWKFNLVKGIRQISLVSSVEEVPISVFYFSKWSAEVGCNNKDGPTVYQKRSQVLIWKDSYTWWNLPSGGV